MSLLARLAALETRRPPPQPPVDEEGPRRLPLQLRRDWPADRQRLALQLIVDEVHGYVCAEHPVTIVLVGEPEPAPSRCGACGEWNMIAVPAFPVVGGHGA